MILVTGGTGYIGSHTCIALVEAGYKPLLFDNLSNSQVQVLARLEQIIGARPEFIEGDVRDRELLDDVFRKYRFSAVIHFAGLKAVGESLEKPIKYFENNVTGSLSLLAAMKRAHVKNFIFSSSANVYGDSAEVPIVEDSRPAPTNPYGRSKLMVEEMLVDLKRADPAWNIACLRYFNPVGAHASGLIGESPQSDPTNLLPVLGQVAAGYREKLQIFGSDYPTPDGSGMRDFIHVMDLAEGHLAALRYCLNQGGLLTVNLGTGRGYTVLQMVRAFEAASRTNIPFEVVPRRIGDIAKSWANTTKAEKHLGWAAKRDVNDMCLDAWRWQQQNPQGFESA